MGAADHLHKLLLTNMERLDTDTAHNVYIDYLNYFLSSRSEVVFLAGSTRIRLIKTVRSLRRRKTELEQECGPDNPEELRIWLAEREDARRNELRIVETLHRLISRVLRLICVLYPSIASKQCGKKSRHRNLYEKVVVLILWRCGDIERNPGPPPISDISRDFCKKMISLLVIKYWESKEGHSLCLADYKKKPVEWPENIWFGDPSTCKNETRNAMLQKLHAICITEKIQLPNQWLTLIQKYQQLTSKGCQASQRKQYADDLKSWLCELRALETADQLCDKLSEIEGPRRMDVFELVMDKLKRRMPDLTLTRDNGLHSVNSGNEFPRLIGRENKETTSDLVPPDNGAHMPIDPGFSYVDLLADSTLNTEFDLTINLLSPYTMTWENSVEDKKGSKRKVDVDGGQGEFVSSKRQNTAIRPIAFQLTSPSTGIQDEDRETTLEDLMTFIDSEMKTNSDENIVLDSNDCAQKGVTSDVGFSGLMDELGGDLSDEFINEFGKQDNVPLQSGT